MVGGVVLKGWHRRTVRTWIEIDHAEQREHALMMRRGCCVQSRRWRRALNVEVASC
jgi:hypothetical protein